MNKWLLSGCASLICGAAVLASGCGKSPPAVDPAASNAQPTGEPVAASSANREIWEVVYRGQEKHGYGFTKISHVEEGGQQLVKVESAMEFRVLRDGQSSTIKANYTTWETTAGEVVKLESDSQFGAAPTHLSGHLANGSMELRSTPGAKSDTQTIAWPKDTAGAAAETRSLAAKPMQPGETRKLRYLEPTLVQVLDVELHAREFELTKLLDGTRSLLRIDSTISIAGTRLPIESIYWTDRAGEIHKTLAEPLGMESYRTTREVALEKYNPQTNLIAETTVKLIRPLENPHSKRRVRYRVHLSKGDPAAAFVTGETQHVRSIDPFTAEISVNTIRPDQGETSPNPIDQPTDADLGASQLIQVDDPRIVEMAKEAAGAEQDPWKIALALEQYVHKIITEKNFSQALSSAADVARTKEGDCTEHAVLLAALARACGIPTRIAVGLVALRNGQAFGYHMWDELYIRGHWIPMDATLGQGGIGAAHLTIAESSLQGPAALTSFLPVARLLGQLKIEVLEAE